MQNKLIITVSLADGATTESIVKSVSALVKSEITAHDGSWTLEKNGQIIMTGLTGRAESFTVSHEPPKTKQADDIVKTVIDTIRAESRPGGTLWNLTDGRAMEFIHHATGVTSLKGELLEPIQALPLGHRVKGLDELVDEILAPAIAGQTLTKVTLEAAYDIAKARIKLRAEHGE